MEESTGADRVFRRQAVHHIAPTDTGFDYPPMHILDSASSIVGTAAVAPALLLLWLVIAADESPAPPLRIWTAFVLGGASVFLIGLARVPLAAFTATAGADWSAMVLHALLTIAVPEELIKIGLIAIVAAWRPVNPDPMDALVYGAAVGLGFAAHENLIYLARFPDMWQSLALLRSILTVPFHGALGIIAGAYLAIARSGLALGAHLHNDHESEEPYIFHFPDGNASLARLLVRNLVPAAISGGTMEDIVLADADYSKLDLPANDVRIRLSSTVVDIAHSDTRRSVDVVYVENGAVRRVRGRHAIMAGYMAMTPYICAEMAEEQKDAIRYFTKIPLVYVNIALTNWRAFDRAGFHRIYCPGSFCEQISLDFPVSIGDYRFSASPDEPIVLHLQKVPTAPELGLNEKDQHRAGRRALYALSYDDFETAMVEQLTEMLEPHGFDASKDIAGITVNRWPHGYAYEYNELYDGPDRSPAAGPHLAARERIGRISFANSDTSAYAYVNGAFDAAIRAVGEQAAVAD